MKLGRTPCDNCNSTGWVCEDHPNMPWNGVKACGCGGAGMPCQKCNRSDDPEIWPDQSGVLSEIL